MAVFYNNNIRLTINRSDVNVHNLARLFKLDENQLVYITTDENRAILPDRNGDFDQEDIFIGTHYKVTGSPRDSSPTVQQPGTQSPGNGYTSRDISFSSASQVSNTGPSPGRDFRSSVSKTFRRKVHIVELQGRELVVTSSTFVSLSNNDFNVSTVTMKVAESLNTDEEMILLDNQNLEIQDCLATQDKGFWQMPTRVLKAATTQTYTAYLNLKYRKRRTSYTNREMTELEGALSEIVETAKKISRTEKTAMVLQVDLKDLREIEEALECTICKGAIEMPVVSQCCKSLIGCKTCLDEWYSTSERCPKCRSDNGKTGRLDLKGLNTVFRVIRPITGVSD